LWDLRYLKYFLECSIDRERAALESLMWVCSNFVGRKKSPDFSDGIQTLPNANKELGCHVIFSASPSRRSMKRATINSVTYEGVAEFIYLSTIISNDKSVQKEIQRLISVGNRTYFAAISLFRNRLLSRATKIRLYKTLIRPAVTYGAETWKMTKTEEQAVLIF
jgi:hypothetical protein